MEKQNPVFYDKKLVSNLKAEFVTEDSLQDCIDFLEQRKETCLFLLGNLSNHGFQLTNHINSGNYWLLRYNDKKVVGVFSLTRRGVLLTQTDNRSNYSYIICKTVKKENIKVKGLIGPWTDCLLLKNLLKKTSGGWSANHISKEHLYFLSLHSIKCKTTRLEKGLSIKFLKEKDFEQWDDLNRAYLKELNLPSDLDNQKRKQNFNESVKNKSSWGVFIDGKLVSIGSYSMRYKDIGQIGGVFTIPEKRYKGYSKLCMKQLLIDSKKIHKLNTLILFTGENNIAAQNLYESLGFQKIDDFGLIF